MASIHKFAFGKKREIQTKRGRLVLVSSPGGGPKYVLRPDEYELARLFDGGRTIEEVMDETYKRRGARVSHQTMGAFVARLLEAGLLQEVKTELTEAPAVPLRSQCLGQQRAAGSDRWLMLVPSQTDLEEANQSLLDSARPSQEDRQGDGVWIPPEQEPEGRIFEAVVEPESPVHRRGWAHRQQGNNDPPFGGADEADIIDAEIIDEDLPHERDDDFGRLSSEKTRSPRDIKPRSRRAAARGKQGPQGLRLLVHLPVRWLLPVGSLFAFPARHWSLLTLLLGICAFSLYGLWVNHLEVVRDLNRFFRPLTVVQVMLGGMLTVNLIGQLARAATYKRLTGQVPSFGIAMLFSLIPRFHADIPPVGRSRDGADRLAIVAATLVSSLSILTVAMLGWLVTKNSPNYLPLLFLAVSALTALRLLLNLNPLATRRPGHFLLAHKLGVPNLRSQAFASLRGKPSGPSVKGRRNQGRELSPWALRLYGVLAIAYLIAVAVAVTVLLGGWLESRWGGTGVVLFLALLSVFALDPVNPKRRRVKAKPAPSYRGTAAGRTRSDRKIRPAVLLLLAAVLAWLGSQPYAYEPGGEFILLPAERSDVRSLISGQITEILVREGETVNKGQVLAKLSADEEFKNIAVSKSRLTELGAELRMAERGATEESIALAEQKVKTARTRADFSRARVERLEDLVDKGHVSRQEFEDALSQAEIDREQLEVARRELDKVLSGTRSEEIEAIKAEISKEEAQLAYYEQQLDYTSLTASIAGRIVSGTLLFAVGDYLNRGELLATIEDAKVMLAEIKIPEADIGEVSVSAAVRIKAWAYPDREFTGVVKHIAPNAEDGDYGKIVRVLVEIDNLDDMLKSEMTGHAKVAGREERAYRVFTRMFVRFFQVELWSWIP